MQPTTQLTLSEAELIEAQQYQQRTGLDLPLELIAKIRRDTKTEMREERDD